jgi:hypothetical protein
MVVSILASESDFGLATESAFAREAQRAPPWLWRLYELGYVYERK